MSETGREKDRTELRNEIAETQIEIARRGGYAKCAQSADGLALTMKLYQLQDQERASR
jgi:hypothetical protein